MRHKLNFKNAGGGHIEWFLFALFFNDAARTLARSKIKRWDIISSCLEEIGTRQSFDRKREKINLEEKITGDEIKHKMKCK